jgi:hypothetical protein
MPVCSGSAGTCCVRRPFSVERGLRMASWLELLLNIIGYGGFVILATWHPRDVEDPSHEIGADESQSAMR